MDHGDHRKLGLNMSEMVIFTDDKATVLGEQFAEPEAIVIYCDLCNEPLAITPEFNDQVFLRCLKCHAVNAITTP
jgi:hypothetical protein